jgi:hypothetical protein
MTTRASHRDKRQHRKGLIMKTPAAQVTGRSPGEEHLMVNAGRHHWTRDADLLGTYTDATDSGMADCERKEARNGMV